SVPAPYPRTKLARLGACSAAFGAAAARGIWQYGAMTRLLRFDGAALRDPGVEPWFDLPDPFRLMAREWFGRMRECGSEVRELLHDGCPVACVRDAPFAYVNAFRAHASVGFFQGAGLPDPAGLLEGRGRFMRH